MIDGDLLPPINEKDAREALKKVDEIIEVQRKLVDQVDESSIDLAELVYEVSKNQYWMTRGFKNEGQYIATTFKGSRAQYYLVRRVWEHLGHLPKKTLKEIGISKCYDLVRIKEHNNGHVPENWMILAREQSRDTFRANVRAHVENRALPPPEDEGAEFITLKIFPDALPIWKKAIEILALEAGTDKSISHLVILMAGDFVAGHNEDGPRLRGKYSFAINSVKQLILLLKDCDDPTVWDRLVGAVREGIEEARE